MQCKPLWVKASAKCIKVILVKYCGHDILPHVMYEAPYLQPQQVKKIDISVKQTGVSSFKM